MNSLARLDWLARRRKQGAITGRHFSPEKGLSIEFAEHREYTPGDDPRNLDWRVMGKSDRNVVKQFVEETNLRVTIVLDRSASMAFQGKVASLSKFDYARQLTASLAYLFIKQGDSAGLVTFDFEIQSYLRAENRPSQVRRICEVLEKQEATEDTAMSSVLHQVAERVPGRGVVMIVSDFLDEPDEVIKSLHHFHSRQHELVLFHLLAEEELNFPFQAFQRFHDLEGTAESLRIDPQAVRSAYLERLESFISQLEAACGNIRADYIPVTTKVPVIDTLIQYLGRRVRR